LLRRYQGLPGRWDLEPRMNTDFKKELRNRI
jgi:hypothetical protein